jgi:hypothetical protein
VLLATTTETPADPRGLYCFTSRGNLRFRHVVGRRVMFGAMPSPGPWMPTAMVLTDEGGGRQAVWVASMDRDQFPSVVEKIDGHDRLLGEFWHPGVVTVLQPARQAGRDAVLDGASSNEFNGAAVAVLDRAHPTGAAPAIAAKFRCTGCPAGRPLAYVVVPGTEVERLQDSTMGVRSISRGGDDVLTVVLSHYLSFERLGRGAGWLRGQTNLLLRPDLSPISAENQPDFRVLHREAERRGVFDHPYGAADDARSLAVARWDGTQFKPVPYQNVGDK